MRCLYILLSSVFILTTAYGETFFSETANGLKIENHKWGVIHIGKDWKQTKEPELKKKGLLKTSLKTSGPCSADYSAQFKSLIPITTLGLVMESRFPVGKRQLKVEGKAVVLPETFQEKQAIVYNITEASKLSLELDSGSILEINGKFGIRILDARKFGQDKFIIRLYFSPSKGELTQSVLSFHAELKQPESNPVDLRPAFNSGFSDKVANDGKGGWTDQGPKNDLHQFKPGKFVVGNTYFNIIDQDQNSGKSAVVLGRQFPASASLAVKEQGKYLYLLHASGWSKAGVLGTVKIDYKDGASDTIELKNGVDIADWWNPVHLPNGFVAWKAENPSNYIGLYFSQFPLTRNDPDRLTFSMKEKNSTWMIIGATLGNTPVQTKGINKSVYISENKDWIKMDVSMKIKPGSILDFSSMLDAPAGKYGHIIVNSNGHFSFSEAPQKRIKFVGINLCATANYPSKAEADAMAEHMARIGYNAVRFHHQDGLLANRKAGTSLYKRNLDKLDYFFYALKKRGIYITTDIYVSRRLYAADKVLEAEENKGSFQMKALLPISASARENWKSFARNWLTHRNPYTGLTWAEDPALIVVSLANENNLYSYWDKSAKIRDLYINKFKHWMATTYPKAKIGEAQLANRRFSEFLYTMQHRSILELSKFLKEQLKIKALITDVNMHNRLPLALIRENLDVVDNHKYHDHPRFPEKAWKLPMNFRQRSSIAKLGTEVPERLFAARLFGKPFNVTEYKFCVPNRFRSEGGPLIGGYAALQDWDSLYQFAWAHNLKSAISINKLGTFDLANDPLSQLSDRQTMLFFRRGDVRPASKAFALHLPKDYWSTNISEEAPLKFSQLGLIARVGILVGDKKTTGIVRLDYKQAAGFLPLPNSPKVEALRKNMFTNGIATSETGELNLDSKKHTLTLVSPLSESITVACGGSPGGCLSIAGATSPQTFSVSSMDNQPISKSKTLLAFHLTNVLNNKICFLGDGNRRLEGWGAKPLLLRRSTVTVKLRMNGTALPKVEAVKIDGTIYGQVNSSFKNGVLQFTADPGCFTGGVMVYHITR